jgi:acetyltransferase-like isoleucine patch superfamily enzyme
MIGDLFMSYFKHPFFKALIDCYFETKRTIYQLRYPRVKLAKGVRIKGSLIVQGCVKVAIGPESQLGKKVNITGSGEVKIGRGVSINGTWIGCATSVTIGDDCLISDCFIADTDYHNLEPHLRHNPPGPKVTAPIVLERNVWIGARSTVMKGVTIGENSVVGLGSVIRKSVPANVVVIGNPQETVKYLDAVPEPDLAHQVQATSLLV